MKQQITYVDGLVLAGITARTNNANEMNPETSQIGALISKYYTQNIAEKLSGRLNPGVTYSVYTDYESDENGEYTYFVGEAVAADSIQDNQFSQINIPAGDYKKFTTDPGKIPDVIVGAWQDIWQMTPDSLGGKRSFITDFEVHDHRAKDPNHAVVDIYIGIN